MNSTETFNQLDTDIGRSISTLLGVRTTEQISIARQSPGYQYQQEKHMTEYWIALGQYSVSLDLSYLAFVINAIEEIVPPVLKTKYEIQNYYELFKTNKEKVIAAFERVIEKPNQIFIGYNEPITMEEYLQKIASDIHNESLNLDYNYQKFKSLS